MSVNWALVLEGAVAIGTLSLATMSALQMRSAERRVRQIAIHELEEPIYAPIIKQLEPLAGPPVDSLPSPYLGHSGPYFDAWDVAREENPALAMRLPQRLREHLDAVAAAAKRYRVGSIGIDEEVHWHFLEALGAAPYEHAQVRLMHLGRLGTITTLDSLSPEQILCYWALGRVPQEWITHLKERLGPRYQSLALESVEEGNRVLAQGEAADHALEAAWEVVVSHPRAATVRKAAAKAKQEAQAALRLIYEELRRGA